jgi:hypothetical protein
VTLPVVFTIAARAEIIVARDWYEARRQGLALQFDLVHKEARRAMLRRFPYGVFFRVLSDRVQVIACLHTSRDPHRWQGRV